MALVSPVDIGAPAPLVRGLVGAGVVSGLVGRRGEGVALVSTAEVAEQVFFVGGSVRAEASHGFVGGAGVRSVGGVSAGTDPRELALGPPAPAYIAGRA